MAARATRLPIYSSFAKEGNLSDLFAKGEAISTLFNVVGMGVGIQLASTICSSMQGKVQCLQELDFSLWHLFSVLTLLVPIYLKWQPQGFLFFIVYVLLHRSSEQIGCNLRPLLAAPPRNEWVQKN